MFRDKFLSLAFALSVVVAAPASGSILLQTTGALTVTDATQLGRLNRAAPPSDWSTTKAFPGAFNTTTVYRYEAFTVNVGITPYIQISVDDPNVALFASAYVGSYVPNPTATNRGLDTNYLGDAGASGNPQSGAPRFFQVIVPMNTNVVVVINEFAATNSGVGQPFSLTIEGFIDTDFDEPPVSTPTPEPSVMFLSSSGIGLIAFMARRRHMGIKAAK